MSRDNVLSVGIEKYVLGSVFSQSIFHKGGVCIYIFEMMYVLIILISLNIAKKKNLEICAFQIETTDKQMIEICAYRSPSGDFNHYLRLLDMALLSLNKLSTEILICRDFNFDCLLSCNHKKNYHY